MKLAVLNPGGNDPEQIFPEFAGAPSEKEHAPVNFHGYAACTGGSFHRKDQRIPRDMKGVLVLIRRDLKAVRQALIELKAVGKTTAVAFKEAGAFQVAELLRKPDQLKLAREICQRADGALAPTEDLVPLMGALGARNVEFLPTPYPVEDERWNFGRPWEERSGMMVGTREFQTPSRNHLAALLLLRPLAEAMHEPVTVFNADGWRGRRMLEALKYPEGLLRVVEGLRPYPAYLRILARHKLVFQLDASAVPGQVAGDALLARTPCLGGNGTTEQLVFPNLCGRGRSHDQLFDLAARLLEHPHDAEEVVQSALDLAGERLSFTRVAARLESFFRRIQR
jgi:hypothetical protein